MNDILWTGDPETQTYEPWLSEAMTTDGKAMPEMIDGEICLRLGGRDGALVMPGEFISEEQCRAAPLWFSMTVRAKQKDQSE